MRRRYIGSQGRLCHVTADNANNISVLALLRPRPLQWAVLPMPTISKPRHAAYLGLREDEEAREIVRAVPKTSDAK